MKKKEKIVSVRTIALAVLILIAGYTVVIGVLIYGFGPKFSEKKIVRKTAAIIPYPAAMVGWKFITFNKMMDELQAVKIFYESQNFQDLGLRLDFSTPDGIKRLEIKKKNILNKLIENSIVSAEAKKRGIVLTDTDVEQEVQRTLAQYGNADTLKSNLQKLYGWTMADFEENIVKPDLYEQKLFENIKKNDSSYAKAFSKITNAYEDLKNGSNFSDVAIRYSEGESAKSGGELGWFSADQMLPEVAAQVMKLNKGETSEIIESSIGYHIVRVEDKKTENSADMVKISQIFVRTKTFADWLIATEKNEKIYIPIAEFKWNSNTGRVEFKNHDLANFENNLSSNSPGDISVMF